MSREDVFTLALQFARMSAAGWAIPVWLERHWNACGFCATPTYYAIDWKEHGL